MVNVMERYVWRPGELYVRDAETAAAWDEAKHPRNPSGTEAGGEFRSPGKDVTADVKAERAYRLSANSSAAVYKMWIDGQPYNVKPESGFPDGRMRDDIRPGKDAQRELAAQEVYQALYAIDPEGFGQLGFPAVHRWNVDVPQEVYEPKPNYTQAPGRGKPFKAVAAEWIPDDIVANLDAGVDDYWPPVQSRGISTQAVGWMSRQIPDGELRSLVLFDQIIGDQDRHGGNAIFNEGRLNAIDHGLTFPSRTDGYETYWNTPTTWAKRRAGGSPALTQREKNTIRQLQVGWPELSLKLKPHLTQAEIKAAKKRLDFLVKNGRFIDHSDPRDL
jgi:hypothetical protein